MASLQGVIGNRALARLVQRQAVADAGVATPSTVPDAGVAAAANAGAPAADAGVQASRADLLTPAIVRCIGVWETNRGGDQPAPRESSLDTVAGVHASMATIEQATMPYAIDAIRAHSELQARAQPALTGTELQAAADHCTAVTTLLGAVNTAAAQGTTAADFISANSALITPTSLANSDVQTMFSAVGLKGKIDTAHQDVTAHTKTLEAAVAGIAQADRLGLGTGSLTAYVRNPGIWGENRAGWQRKAVNAMPGNVGARIEAVATADNGTALAQPVVKQRAGAYLAQHPSTSDEDVVKHVAQQNNPGEAGYGDNVWATYQRLYPAAHAATPAADGGTPGGDAGTPAGDAGTP